MSFTKEDLKKAVKESVAEIWAYEKVVEERERAKAPSQPEESNADHVLSCPNCFKDFAEKLIKTSEVECKDCGFPLGSKELAKQLNDCPSCHGKDTRIHKHGGV